MEVLRGIAVSPGVAISPAYLVGRQEFVIPTSMVDTAQAEEEVSRVRSAVDSAAEKIKNLRGRLAGTIAERYAAILDAHLALLTDEKLFNEIASRIREQGFSAEHAVSRVLGEYARQLASVDDAYLSQRAQDIFDIQQRMLNELSGEKHEPLKELTRPVAVVAHDLTPSETLSLDRDKVTGFATDAGGSTSHTAILARALDIPAVVGLGRATDAVAGGDMVIIDGNKGLLVVNPDDATLERYRSSKAEIEIVDRGLGELRELPAQTVDGIRVELYGNIELPEEVATAVRNGAAGIGLFRTEFLFLQAGREPSEEDQFFSYLHAAEELGDLPLTIRTFDLGGEKLPAEHRHAAERNPALGCRSIRFSFEHPAMFKSQLRAILRAGAHGNVRLLFPMISSLEELHRAKAFLDETREELESEGVPFGGNIPLGIMVEVPSVAVAPEPFAREVDFLSIGTNDLVQYALAVERVNEHVAALFTPAHPAILRLLRNVIDVAARTGTPVNLCGEISADPLYTALLVGLGFTELSLNPPAIPRIKRVIRSISYEEARRLADRALEQPSAEAVTALLTENLSEEARRLIA